MNASPDFPTVPCELCGVQTRMIGTKRCDQCWELERRIEAAPQLARQILERVEKEHATPVS